MVFPVDSRLASRRRWFVDRALLLTAALLAALGIVLGRLHEEQGPPAQRINVRWAPQVSVAERAAIEQDRGLYSGRELQARTWSYLLRDRSTDNIGRLVRDPRVEDTFHIDPVASKVVLDRPALDPRLRALLETDALGFVAMGLAAMALVLALVARRPLILLARAAVGTIGWIARELPSAMFHQKYERVECSGRELAAGAGLSLLFLVPLLIYGPFEDEIVQATIMPNQVFYRALFRGEWLYWLNDLGFGSPMPLGDPLLFHPVFAPLAAFASLRVTLSAVWIAHSLLMAVYLLRLLAVSGVAAPALRIVVLVLYFVSVQFAFYFYASDWLQMAITWSLYPVLVFQMRAALMGGARARFWRTAAALGLLFGFWVINAHPGYIIPLTLVLAAYVLAAAPFDRRVYLCLAVGGVLCATIAAPRIYMLLYEVRLFPPGGGMRESGLPSSYLGAILWPWIDLDGRAPFIGFGVAAAVAAACGSRATFRDAHLRGCVAALAAAAVFNLVPASLLQTLLPAVGAYLFRDGITFFGLLVAAHVFQRGIRSPRPLVQSAALLLVLAQSVQQTALVLPNFVDVTNRGDRLLFYRHQNRPFGLARVLVDNAARYGSRLYLSPSIDRRMRMGFSADGIHFSSDLVLHGLNPVNGWFKNVSMAALYPPVLLMESIIGGDVDVIRNQPLLDVLGIDLVLSTEGETGVPSGLIVAERPRVRAAGLDDLVLLANPTAWPRAVLLAPDAAALQLPRRDSCEHSAALCRDFAPLARTRLDGHVALEVGAGRYAARVQPADQERLMFFSTLYRPEWEARAGDTRLQVRPVADAFLGITVPPGVSEIAVAYTPRVQIALTWIGNIAFFGLAGVVLLPPARRVIVRRRAAEAAAA
jgi:hypothetical protein